jgi:hypothetical protein
MSTRRETCVVIGCDTCGKDFSYDEEGVPHFRTEQAAIEAVIDTETWEVTGGRVVCGDCLARIGCELMGHPWNPWITSPLDPQIAWRTCGACSAYEKTLRALIGNNDDATSDGRDEGQG